jgi:hypothetical protein
MTMRAHAPTLLALVLCKAQTKSDYSHVTATSLFSLPAGLVVLHRVSVVPLLTDRDIKEK